MKEARREAPDRREDSQKTRQNQERCQITESYDMQSCNLQQQAVAQPIRRYEHSTSIFMRIYSLKCSQTSVQLHLCPRNQLCRPMHIHLGTPAITYSFKQPTTQTNLFINNLMQTRRISVRPAVLASVHKNHNCTQPTVFT
jgi:hypothetical protein